MSALPKEESKIPGGLAGGRASAERPEEDRRESARKAAATRHTNMVGTGEPATAGQVQSYEAEQRDATWAIEREGQEGAVKQQLAQGDKEAEAMESYRDKQDPDYHP